MTLVPKADTCPHKPPLKGVTQIRVLFSTHSLKVEVKTSTLKEWASLGSPNQLFGLSLVLYSPGSLPQSSVKSVICCPINRDLIYVKGVNKLTKRQRGWFFLALVISLAANLQAKLNHQHPIKFLLHRGTKCSFLFSWWRRRRGGGGKRRSHSHPCMPSN